MYNINDIIISCQEIKVNLGMSNNIIILFDITNPFIDLITIVNRRIVLTNRHEE